MARINVNVSDETREKLIELAGGERSMGAKLDDLVAAEYARQSLTPEELAKIVPLVHDMAEVVNGMTELQIQLLERVAEIERQVAALTSE